MARIELKLENQLLTIRNQEIISSGDVNCDTCSFLFDGTWDGYMKTAVFYQDKRNVQYAVLSGDDTCVIPSAATAREGNMYVGVFGISGSKVLTSTVERVYVRQGSVSGDTVSTEPGDDVFLAVMAQYQAIAERMQACDVKMDEFIEIMNAMNAYEAGDMALRLKAAEDKLAEMDTSLEENVRTAVSEVLGGLRFAKDGEGRWGYIVPDGETVIPFGSGDGSSGDPETEIKTYKWQTVESSEAFSQEGNAWEVLLTRNNDETDRQHIFLVVNVPKACKTIITFYGDAYSRSSLYVNDTEIPSVAQSVSGVNVRETIDLKEGLNYLFLESYLARNASSPSSVRVKISFAPIMA